MLSNFTAFEKEATQYRANREQSKKLEQTLSDEVQKDTKRESVNLERAMSAYRSKLKTVMHNRREQVDQIQDYHKKMSSTLQKTFSAFQQTIEAIKRDPGYADDRAKMTRINEIAEKITRSLLTENEAQQFKKFAGNMVIIVPSDSLQLSRLHRPRISDSATKRTKITYE